MKQLLILSVLACLTTVFSYARQWPDRSLGGGEKLLFNESMIEQMRQRIDNHQWARDIYTKIRHELSVPAAPSQGEGERFAVGIWYKNAALYYRISGDEKFLPNVFSAIVSNFKLDKAEQPLFTDTTRRLRSHWEWCLYKSNLLVAYDLLQNHPVLVPYKELMKHRLDEIIAQGYRFLRGRKSVNNTGFWVTTVVGMAGYMRGDKAAIAEAIDGACGFKAMLAKFRDQGRFNPEPINYTTNYIDGCLLILAEASRNNSMEDLYAYVAPNGASIKRLADSYFDIANANGMAVGNGDFGDYVLINEDKVFYGGIDIFYGKGGPHRSCHKMELFNARYNDPKFAWAIAQNPARDNKCFVFWGYTALTHGAEITETRAPEIKSEIFPGMGNAIIRSVEDTTYWNSDAITAHMRSGKPLQSHNQNDHFNLTINAYGKNIYKDWFLRWDYLAPRASNGYRNATPLSPRIIGHNTVSVDFAEPTVFDVQFSDITRRDGMQIVSAAGEVYKGVRQKRTIGVTKEYVIDIFTLESDQEHNYDYALHSVGKASYSGVGIWQEYMQLNDEYRMGKIDKQATRPNNVWFSAVRRAQAKKDVVADMVDTDGIGMVAILLNDTGTEVIAAETPYFVSIRGWDDISPKATIPERKPMTVFRRQGKNAEFCVLHQPYRDKVSRLKFSRKGNLFVVEGDAFTDTFNIESLEYHRKNR
ncbi:alginate lyase family protein [Gallalistipes aquisgranensis]|uniref:alginate lyase family protein n=1 Tax=Gallalistipes aquisgranensis TaxID=2779358 RepID=UPI001CF83655|nr:alginate lyase family protein [Gallalistipes aquisgranensis]MBE5032786.1 hypothetical protein [Gallalistipes aquisgranensis]